MSNLKQFKFYRYAPMEHNDNPSIIEQHHAKSVWTQLMTKKNVCTPLGLGKRSLIIVQLLIIANYVIDFNLEGVFEFVAGVP